MPKLTIEQLLEVTSVFREHSQEKILKRTVDIIPSAFNWKGCSVFLYNEYEDCIQLVRTSVALPENFNEIKYRRGEGLTGWVFKHAKPLLLKDMQKSNSSKLAKKYPDINWVGKFSESGTSEIKSFMAVPILSQNKKLLGVIRTVSDTSNFSKSDLEIFLMIAKYVAMAIENSEFLRQEKRKTNYLELLMKVGTQILSYFELDELLSFVAENTAKTISSETCEIYLRKNENKNVLVLKGGYGIPSDLIDKAEHKIGEGLTGTIVKDNRVIRSKNVLELPEYKGKYRNQIKDHLKYGDRVTFLGVPINIKDETIGAIKLYNKIPNEISLNSYFTEDDEKYLQILTDMISVAIENVKFVDSMKYSAIKTMKSQRLTALGTLAMRIPNDVVNPLTETQLGINNILKKIEKSDNREMADFRERLVKIQNNLKKVSNEVRILQEFSTKAGFLHVKRTWEELIDESLLFLTNELMANKVIVDRKINSQEFPEIKVDPNEIIEVMITLVSLAIYRFRHYGSKVTISSQISENKILKTSIIGVDNKSGVEIKRKSMSEMFGEIKSYGPYQFSLDVVSEIVKSNYNGSISFADSEEYTRIIFELPISER
ncbi:MAG: GAF domain-containing protein [Candidatus Marinimicrobia bacterium]|nr:GAF domain-containing protein [Candidatus Neomarinimicrobiota bacterium]